MPAFQPARFSRARPIGLKRKWTKRGDLRNPPETRDYPLAPWWREQGGQTMPDSIVGNLIHFGCATPSLVDKTKAWALANYSSEKVRENEWLFMAYHAFDFFFAIDDLPDLQAFRRATIDNIVACAIAAPDNQYDSLFVFAPAPDSMIARALPERPDWIAFSTCCQMRSKLMDIGSTSIICRSGIR